MNAHERRIARRLEERAREVPSRPVNSAGREYDYFDPTCGGEPYFIDEDQGYGTCPECGSALENWGAQSDGDGDLYDALGCPLCQEQRGRAHERWFGLDGNVYDSEEAMWWADAAYEDAAGGTE